MSELESLVSTRTSSHIRNESINERPDAILLWKENQKSHVPVYLAILIQTITAVFLIVLVFVDVPIKERGSLSNGDRSLYITGTTVIASIISVYSSTQIVQLWLSKLLPNPEHASSVPRARLDRIWSLLGIGKWAHQFKFFTFNASFLITGLTTTAIVAGITPTGGYRRQSARSHFFVNDDSNCLVYSEKGTNGWFNWNINKNAYVSLNTDQRTACPSEHVIGMMGDITYTPSGYAYNVAGIPIHPSALGTPFKYGGGATGFYGTFGIGYRAASFSHALQCLPIVTKNPVNCRGGGNVTVQRYNVTVNSRDCDITTPIYKVNPLETGATALGACTGNRDVGKATVVMGGVNAHASLLAQTMGDKDGVAEPPQGQPPSYSAICDIDIGPSLGFRTVNFSHTDSQSVESHIDIRRPKLYGAIFTVSSDGSSCTPRSSPKNGTSHAIDMKSITNNSTLATGASASWSLLVENEFRDGWWPTLYQITQAHNGTKSSSSDSFVFDGSRNALEDALGLTSAAALSNFWANAYGDNGRDLNFTGGSLIVTGLRVGPGGTWALIYAVPEIWAVGIMVWLLRIKRKEASKGKKADYHRVWHNPFSGLSRRK